MKVKSISKRISAVLLCLVLLTSLLSVGALAADTGIPYIDENGDEQTRTSATEVAEGVTEWTGSDPDGGWYVVNSTLTISERVNVTGDVHLILADGCTLTASQGINVTGDNSLTIYGQAAGTGALTADGGSNQAGIGGGNYSTGGTVTINGGKVTANGGAVTANGGGNDRGAGGTITINGGTVKATGGNWAAGIGGGGGYYSAGAGGNITITGGTVTATGGSFSGSLGGADIGGGAGYRGGGDSGTFSTGNSGRAVIFASSISDNTPDDWSGVIFQGTTGQVYGSSITPTEDFTIPENYTLTIEEGQTLTISKGITLTNNGTITVNDGGALVNQGTIIGSGKIQMNGGSTVQTGDGPEITVGQDTTGATAGNDGSVTLPNGGSATIGSGDNTTTITTPDGGIITPNDNGSVTIPGGSTVQIGDGPSITIPSEDVTIKPNDDGAFFVTVTFDSQGGSQVASQTVAVGTAVTRPADPTRSGYSFQGWYTAADGDTQWDFADPVTGNMTLFARWTQNSSGGGGGTTTYPPAVSNPENGNVTVTPRNPKRGDTVTITPDPDTGYEVDEIIVRDQNGNEIAITQNQDGTCTFIQPSGKVTIEVTYRPAQEPEQPWENPFHDVDEDAWYAEAVQYVQENGLMTGTGPAVFAPDATSSRSMVVTTLWRLEGSPVVNYAMDFTDVAEGSWYAEAVRWAASEDIAGGYGGSSFGPSDTITREQLAVMLYRYAQEQGCDVTASADLSGFSDVNDVSDYALEALKWASAAGIVNSTDENTLTPQGSATRAQVAVMLMRFCENVMQ